MSVGIVAAIANPPGIPAPAEIAVTLRVSALITVFAKLSNTETGIPVYSREAGETKEFILLFGMCPWAGNEYQNRKFYVDVDIWATQHSKNDIAKKEVLG